MNDSLNLVSLNMHGGRHLDMQVPFLKSTMPDIVCLQEVFERDYIYLNTLLETEGIFAPMYLDQYRGSRIVGGTDRLGVAVLTKAPTQFNAPTYYFGDPNTLHTFTSATQQELVCKVLLTAVINPSLSSSVTVGTTHFTWSHGGVADDNQRHDLKGLLTALNKAPEIILCGDFNAPRGGEIFTILTQKYTDNIPQKYITSIDGNLHRAGQLELMVDGLFSTPEYEVNDVHFVPGLSDHLALVANVRRKK